MVFEKSLVIIGISIVLALRDFDISSLRASSKEISNIMVLSRTSYKASIAEKYDLWMSKYGRVYPDSEEKERRFAIFKSNVEYVEKFNRDGNNRYKLGLDEFADLSREDFVNQYIKPTEQTSSADVSFRYESLGGPDVPLSIDWRMHGAVTTVKNQGPCGCCWAFSAVAALEGIVQIRTGQLRSLSEQQLVDCSGVYGIKGCHGGTMVTAFECILQNRGIASEANYPYQATDGICDTNNSNCRASSASITGYKIVPRNIESDLIKAVSMQPVSIGIHVTWPDFGFYKSGVFTAIPGGQSQTTVSPSLATGIPQMAPSTGYSRMNGVIAGGENGYMRILRDAGPPEGLCGLATTASYPIID